MLVKVYTGALLNLVVTDTSFIQANIFATILFEVCNSPM